MAAPAKSVPFIDVIDDREYRDRFMISMDVIDDRERFMISIYIYLLHIPRVSYFSGQILPFLNGKE